MRKAVSLAIDRDTIVEVINDLEAWRGLGLDREYAHSNYVPAGLKRWWTDPRGPEMGTEAQWFQYDPQKGKQLVSAAGFPNGYETELHYASNNYAQVYRDTVTLIADMLKEAGITAKLSADDYGTVHNIKGWAGELPGIVWGISTGFADPDLYLDYLFGPNSTRNQMRINDETFFDMFAKQNQELDEKKRWALLIDIYRYQADKMRMVPFSYAAVANYTVGYNWYHNFWSYRNSLAGQGNATESLIHRWIDKA